MLKQLEVLKEAEKILDEIQFQVWKETQGPIWRKVCNARDYVRQQQAELLADN